MQTIVAPQLPNDIYHEILSSLPFSGSDWLHAKLVCKTWYNIGATVFDPNKGNVWERMIRAGNIKALSALMKDKRIVITQSDVPKLWMLAIEEDGIYDSDLLECSQIDPSSNNNEALLLANKNGAFHLVNLLLDDKRVNPEVGTEQDNINRNFRQALLSKDFDLVTKFLRDEKVDPSVYENFAIRYASKDLSNKFCHFLLDDSRVDPACFQNDVLGTACYSGRRLIVKRLLNDPRMSANKDYSLGLVLAALDGRKKIIDMLITSQKIELNQFVWRAACTFPEVEKLLHRLLADQRLDPSANNNEAIIIACRFGNIKIVDRLLQDKRVDPSARDNTAMRMAKLNGHLPIIQLLQRPRGHFLASDTTN